MAEREIDKYPIPDQPDIDLTAFESLQTDQGEDYDETDMAYVLSQRDFDCWFDVLTWMKEFGIHDTELTPGEKKFLVSDIARLYSQHSPFTNDPFLATKEAKATRRHIEGLNDEENI